jgi:very-short-patch-repair endonuclease
MKIHGANLPKAKSEPEERFALTWKVLGGPRLEREFAFAPPRKWRFDFARPIEKIAIEIEGGVHEGEHRGRHMREEGFAADCEKYNAAALMGWRIVRLTPDMIQPTLLNRIILELGRSL